MASRRALSAAARLELAWPELLFDGWADEPNLSPTLAGVGNFEGEGCVKREDRDVDAGDGIPVVCRGEAMASDEIEG